MSGEMEKAQGKRSVFLTDQMDQLQMRQRVGAPLTESGLESIVPLFEMGDMTTPISRAKQEAHDYGFADRPDGKWLSPGKVDKLIQEHSSFFVGERPTGERVIFGIVPRLRSRTGRDNDIPAALIAQKELAAIKAYLKAVDAAEQARQITPFTALALREAALGSHSGEKSRRVHMASRPVRVTESEENQSHRYTPTIIMEAQAPTRKREAGTKHHRQISGVYLGSSILGVGSIILAACGPVAPTPAPPETKVPTPDYESTGQAANTQVTENETKIAETQTPSPDSGNINPNTAETVNVEADKVAKYVQEFSTSPYSADYTLVGVFQVSIDQEGTNDTVSPDLGVITEDGGKPRLAIRSNNSWVLLDVQVQQVQYDDNTVENFIIFGDGVNPVIVQKVDQNGQPTGENFYYNPQDGNFYKIENEEGKGGNALFALANPDLKTSIEAAQEFMEGRGVDNWNFHWTDEGELTIVDSDGKVIGEVGQGGRWQEPAPPATSTPEVSPDAFEKCEPAQWKSCEVPLTADGLIDPSYFAWLETIPVEFPEGVSNKPLETEPLGDSILDKDTTKFNLVAGHAKNQPNKYYYIEGKDEFIYPVAVWSDKLQKPVWIVMVWNYLGKQSETFLRGEYIPLLSKPERPNTKFAFQFNPRDDMYMDDIINAYAEAHPDMTEAIEKFKETGDPSYLPKNPVIYLNASK